MNRRVPAAALTSLLLAVVSLLATSVAAQSTATIATKTCTLVMSATTSPDGTSGWSVQFKRNGGNQGSSDSTAPYGPRSATVNAGTYALTAVWTKNGNSQTQALGTATCAGGTITTSGGSAPPPPPLPPSATTDSGNIRPQIYGYGTQTRAAYGCGANPSILHVTSLDPDAPGGMRAILAVLGPKVIVFDVAGNIDLNDSDLVNRENCVTVAGQTAPSPGISIIKGGLVDFGSDVMVQHVRIRAGDHYVGDPVPQTARHDALLTYTYGPYFPTRVVYDHVSLSWSMGKLANNAMWGELTLWRCILGEALFHVPNGGVTYSAGQPSSLATLQGGGGGFIGKYSEIQNLYAHNADRNPETQENSDVQVLNNVIYGWGVDGPPYSTGYPSATFFYADASPGPPGPTRANIIGNVYIAGPDPHPYPLSAIGVWSVWPDSAIYIADTLRDETRAPITEFDLNPGLGFNPRVSAPPLPLFGYAPLPSSQTQALVLASAGARPKDRDAVDARLVSQAQSRTGKVIGSQTEVGGWPQLTPRTQPFVVPANPHAVAPGQTVRTNLEQALEAAAVAVE